MSTSYQSGAIGLERLPCLKYYNVLKRENRLNWILNNFYLKLFFSYNPYFWQRWTWKLIYFSVLVNYNILNMAIFQGPNLHTGGTFYLFSIFDIFGMKTNLKRGVLPNL